jgi:hypothetical protein
VGRGINRPMRPLDASDFHARRFMLDKDDFALASGLALVGQSASGLFFPPRCRSRHSWVSWCLLLLGGLTGFHDWLIGDSAAGPVGSRSGWKPIMEISDGAQAPNRKFRLERLNTFKLRRGL